MDIFSALQKSQDIISKLVLCNPEDAEVLREELKDELVYIVSEKYVDKNNAIVITDTNLKLQMLESYRAMGRIK